MREAPFRLTTRQAIKTSGLVGVFLFVIVTVFWAGFSYSNLSQVTSAQAAANAAIAVNQAAIVNLTTSQAAIKQSLSDTNQQLALIREQLQQVINNQQKGN